MTLTAKITHSNGHTETRVEKTLCRKKINGTVDIGSRLRREMPTIAYIEFIELGSIYRWVGHGARA